MEIVKKWASCVVSFIAGVLALALSVCSGMVVTQTMGGKSESEITKAFKVITNSDLMKQAESMDIANKFTTMKVFSIILMVVAVLLLVYSIVMLLKNVNIIKSDSKIFAIVGLVLAVLFLIATIGVLVSSNVYAGAVTDIITEQAKLASAILGTKVTAIAKIGVYQPIMLVTGIVAAGTIVAFEIKKVK